MTSIFAGNKVRSAARKAIMALPLVTTLGCAKSTDLPAPRTVTQIHSASVPEGPRTIQFNLSDIRFNISEKNELLCFTIEGSFRLKPEPKDIVVGDLKFGVTAAGKSDFQKSSFIMISQDQSDEINHSFIQRFFLFAPTFARIPGSAITVTFIDGKTGDPTVLLHKIFPKGIQSAIR